MQRRNGQAAGRRDLSGVTRSPWLQLAVAILASDGLGEELAGDVLREHIALSERSRKDLASALHTWLRGASMRRDLESLVKMAPPLRGRDGFKKHIQPSPTLAACLSRCWAEIHADETAGAATGVLSAALREGEAGALRLLGDDPRQRLLDACARAGLRSRRGLVAVAVVCLQRAAGLDSAVPAGEAPVDWIPGMETDVGSGGSAEMSSIEGSMDEPAVEEAAAGGGADRIGFADATLQAAWHTLQAIPSDSALWDEGEPFVAAVAALVDDKLSERAKLAGALSSAIDELNRETSDTLDFLGFEPLRHPQGLTTRRAAEQLGGVQELARQLAHCGQLRKQMVGARLAQMSQIQVQLSELSQQICDLHGRLQDAAGRAAAFAPPESAIEPPKPAEPVLPATPPPAPPLPAPPPPAPLPDMKLEMVRRPERMSAKKTDSSVILCLDFGTARSKAFATESAGGRTLELALPIGTTANTGERFGYSLGSSVWIDEEHQRIYFGQKAIDRSGRPMRPDHDRIDSFKDRLSLAEVVDGELRDPAASRLDERSNPTKVPFTHGDILLLFLGFLTWTAEESLRRYKPGPRPGDVRRRFALPSWEDAKRTAGTGLLKRYLARAQVVADSVGDRWHHGISIEQAKVLTDAVFRLPVDDLPVALLDEGVLEPIAAGATRIEIKTPQKRLVMIIDVGAGTTDYAIFVAHEHGESALRMIPVAVHAWNCAGNHLDNVLRIILVDKTGCAGSARDALNLQIQNRQREYKETLFKRGEVSVVLGDGAHAVSLTRDEFLQDARVVNFAKNLEDHFEETLEKAGVRANDRFGQMGILVVLTGGGANLPMVRDLAKGKSCKRGVERQEAPLLPENVPQVLEQEYLQLAVAWGGAMPELPVVSKTMKLPDPPVGPPHPGLAGGGSLTWHNEGH